MLARKWIKGGLVLLTLVVLSGWALQLDAWARAGGGRSTGSRGSRTATPPKPYTAPSPTKPAQPAPTVTPTTPPPQPSGFLRSFGGGLLGGLVGGLLFSSFLGAAGAHEGIGGTGIGLMEILLILGIGLLIYRWTKKRQEVAVAQPYQAGAAGVEAPGYPPASDQPQAPAPQADELQQGLRHIRQLDPLFDEVKFRDGCMDVFLKIQSAFANRDISPVNLLLTEEMYQLLQGHVEQMKAEKKISRMENIAVRSVDLTEVWQESGSDYITVRVFASLLDYVLDEATGKVLEGSNTEPVQFEEYWTFTRPSGDFPWQLSAINQPA